MARRLLEKQLQEKKGVYKLPAKFSKCVETAQFKYPAMRKGVYCLQFSPDSSYLAVGYTDGSVEALDIQDKVKYIKDVKNKKYGVMAATCIRFHPKYPHMCYVSAATGTVEACNYDDGSHDTVVEEDGNHIQAIDFDSRGKTICTGGTDLCIRAYDTGTNREIRCMEGYTSAKPQDTESNAHTQRIFAIKFHPTDFDIFLTGGWDNNVKIWDMRRSNAVVTTLEGPHVCGDTLDFQGTEILCGSWMLKDALQIWDYTYRKKVKTVPMHQTKSAAAQAAQMTGTSLGGEYVYCCQFCDNDVIVAGGSGTASIQAINKNTNELLGEVFLQDDNAVQALDVTQGGSKIAFGGVGEILRTAKLI